MSEFLTARLQRGEPEMEKNKDGKHYDKKEKTKKDCSDLVKLCGLDENLQV